MIFCQMINLDSGQYMRSYETRNPIDLDIPAEETGRVQIGVEIPSQPGRYQVEVSLVQMGMDPSQQSVTDLARSAQIILVGEGRSFAITGEP